MKEHLRLARTPAILCIVCIACVFSSVSIAKTDTTGAAFDSAHPIWPASRETEKNLFVGFRAVFDCSQQQDPLLRVAGSSLYRVYLNGQFIGHGPARGPHGYYRVDEWPLGDCLSERNVLAIEVAAYNVNSFYLLDEPAFLQAEIVSGAKTLASTAGKGANFEATVLKRRLQKVQRYSFQRPFIEYYRLNEGDDRWWEEPLAESARASCSILPHRNLLIRRVAYPRFLKRQPLLVVSKGKLERDVPVARLWKDRALVNVGPKLKGYRESELDVVPSIELQKIRSASRERIGESYRPDKAIKLSENEFSIVDLGTNLTGFIGASIRCAKPSKLYFTFDEILSKDDVDFKRLACVNSVCYELEPGTHRLESFEPYTMRYLKLNVLQGDCEVKNLYLREYANSETEEARFSCSDPRLNRIFEAARQTFKQNATDIFMDCPSRERAERIRAVIRRQSFDGEFFVDNAVRKDGRLQVTRNRTEVCQYFAFFFDVATPRTHGELWNKLVRQFGPERKQTNAFAEIHPANAFIGNYLRSELLSRYDHPAQIKKELVDYYLYMAEQTGTLWEHVGASASCNHGFASHVAHSLYRDVLGVYSIDTQEKVIHLRIADVGLDWCEGRILTPHGPVVVKWWKDGSETAYRAEAPAGYVIETDNLTGNRLSLR